MGPLSVNLAIMAILYGFAGPAFAATVQKKKGSLQAIPSVPEKVPLWRKIVEGATYSGKSRKAWKAGDTRGEIAALLNSVSSFVILGVAAFFAFLIQKKREFSQGNAFNKELVRVTEYKEVDILLFPIY